MKRTRLLAGILAATSSPAFAQTSLSDEQAAAAFGVRERVIDASLSPDGSKVALVQPGPEQSTVLSVLDLAKNSNTPVYLAKGDPFTLNGCGWVSDLRLVCTLYGISNREGGYEGYSRLIGVNADGTNAIPLGRREASQDFLQRSDGYVVDWRDGKSNDLLIARVYIPATKQVNTGGSNDLGLGVDLVDTVANKGKRVESPNPRATSYLGDGQGNIRIMSTDEAFRAGYETRGERTYVYRTPGSKDWKPFGVYSRVTELGMFPIAVDGRANIAYVLEKTNGRDALYRVSLDGTMKKDLAFAHPQVDVAGLVRVGRQGRVVGARYSLDTPMIEYFDPAYRTMATGLSKALSKLPLIGVIDSSADETRHLIHAASDTDPGRYYMYDSAKTSLSPLSSERPELAGVKLGTVKPITYRTGDGTVVPGYLTLPPGGAQKGLPAIVMPHGGPASRDEWGFDWLAQFFVSRGFAVLQPNFRGSSGYGDAWFQQNGFRSWKTAVGDVNDAGRWLVKEGIADPSKLAIVGWSYGGYAALQSNVLDADLYKAVIAIAPVTDLGMLRSENDARIDKDYIGEGAQLTEGSPTRNVAAFKAPVLMFHGTTDINVSSKETEAMDRALKKAGKSSQAVLYRGIDHQLRDTAVRTDMLTKSAAFLRKSLKM